MLIFYASEHYREKSLLLEPSLFQKFLPSPKSVAQAPIAKKYDHYECLLLLAACGSLPLHTRSARI